CLVAAAEQVGDVGLEFDLLLAQGDLDLLCIWREGMFVEHDHARSRSHTARHAKHCAPTNEDAAMSTTTRTILHVDLDAFFAAAGVREDPSLAGRPVVVGADPRGGRGRGVVAAASYEARAFGIHSAMPISQAYRRCPTAAFLRPRGRLYGAVSERFMAILARYTDLVQPLSIDEAFLDVTASRALFGDGAAIPRRIKDGGGGGAHIPGY